MKPSRCPDCGTEILWGSRATPLDHDLGYCSACPALPEARAALAAGLAVAAHVDATVVRGDYVARLAAMVPPYSREDSPAQWRAWKAGCEAGLRHAVG